MNQDLQNPNTWVFLPGLDGTGAAFDPVIPRLPPNVTPLVIPYPEATPLGYEELVGYVRERLPAEPFLLIAESFGGPLAIKLAATAPEGMVGAVISASFARRPFPGFLRFFARPGLFSLLAHYSPDWLIRWILASRDSSPEIIRMARNLLTVHSPRVIAHRARAALMVDATDELKGCRVPLLFFGGTADNLIWRHNIRYIEKQRPDVAMIRLDSPHLLLQLHSDEALKAIGEFLRRIAA